MSCPLLRPDCLVRHLSKSKTQPAHLNRPFLNVVNSLFNFQFWYRYLWQRERSTSCNKPLWAWPGSWTSVGSAHTAASNSYRKQNGYTTRTTKNSCGTPNAANLQRWSDSSCFVGDRAQACLAMCRKNHQHRLQEDPQIQSTACCKIGPLMQTAFIIPQIVRAFLSQSKCILCRNERKSCTEWQAQRSSHNTAPNIAPSHNKAHAHNTVPTLPCHEDWAPCMLLCKSPNFSTLLPTNNIKVLETFKQVLKIRVLGSIMRALRGKTLQRVIFRSSFWSKRKKFARTVVLTSF